LFYYCKPSDYIVSCLSAVLWRQEVWPVRDPHSNVSEGFAIRLYCMCYFRNGNATPWTETFSWTWYVSFLCLTNQICKEFVFVYHHISLTVPYCCIISTINWVLGAWYAAYHYVFNDEHDGSWTGFVPTTGEHKLVTLIFMQTLIE